MLKLLRKMLRSENYGSITKVVKDERGRVEAGRNSEVSDSTVQIRIRGAELKSGRNSNALPYSGAA